MSKLNIKHLSIMERSIKEILEVCIEVWEEQDKTFTNNGLCFLKRQLRNYNYITKNECFNLGLFLDNNKPTPTKHPQFYVDHFMYWWDKNNKEIRLNFLKYLLSLQ